VLIEKTQKTTDDMISRLAFMNGNPK